MTTSALPATTLGQSTPRPTGQTDPMWEVGQIVVVKPRTWAGINRLGGQGRVTQVHIDDATGLVAKVDVKYILGGSDKAVDVHYVETAPVEKEEQSAGRRRRQRSAADRQKEPDEEVEPKNSRKVKLSFDAPSTGLEVASAPATKSGKKRGQNENEINASKPPVKKQRGKATPQKKGVLSLTASVDKPMRGRKENGNQKKPAAKRKLSPGKGKREHELSFTPSKAAVPTPDVPREISFQIKKTPISSASPAGSLGSLTSPLEALAKTPRRQQYMLSSDVRNRIAQGTSPQFSLQSSRAAYSSNRSLSSRASSAARNLYGYSPRVALNGGEKMPKRNNVSNRKRTMRVTQDADQRSPAVSCASKRSVASSPSLATPSKRATLHSEHERVMRDASQFIQEVVVNKSPSAIASKDETHQQLLQNTKAMEEDQKPSAVDAARRSAFFAAFTELMEARDDGCVPEAEVAEEINQFCLQGKPFDPNEVQKLVEHLCVEDKLMRSDEQLYLV